VIGRDRAKRMEGRRLAALFTKKVGGGDAAPPKGGVPSVLRHPSPRLPRLSSLPPRQCRGAAGPDAALVAARTTQAAQYLIGAQEKDGRFRYEYDFLAGKYRKLDNIVRQAAAGFVLAEYLASSPSAGAAAAVRRALGYYIGQSNRLARTAWS